MSVTSVGHSILLVDDDNQVRRFCKIVLERAGYQVLDADSPITARRLWEENASKVELLVTDYEMPDQNGLELASELQSQKPDLKTVMISGRFADEIGVPDSMPFLHKPFSAKDLAGAVRNCLEVSMAAN